jgi:hypothetical protein
MNVGGARGSIVAWGPMLQVGSSLVRFLMRSSGRLSLQQKWVPGIFLGGKGRPARKADNLTAICEPNV